MEVTVGSNTTENKEVSSAKSLKSDSKLKEMSFTYKKKTEVQE